MNQAKKNATGECYCSWLMWITQARNNLWRWVKMAMGQDPINPLKPHKIAGINLELHPPQFIELVLIQPQIGELNTYKFIPQIGSSYNDLLLVMNT